MKILVGLGNPGSQYRMTRHNVGFMVLDRLSEAWAAPFSRERFGGLLAKARQQGEEVLLLKPLTFMNRSGECVGQALRYSNGTLDDLLVIVDDVNLPLGKLRIRAQGSAGGHNGLKSIIEHLGSDAFPRVRIGVGLNREGSSLSSHVLGAFSKEERDEVNEMVSRAAAAAAAFVTSPLVQVMNAFN